MILFLIIYLLSYFYFFIINYFIYLLRLKHFIKEEFDYLPLLNILLVQIKNINSAEITAFL